jgi:hypothetical protein
MPSGWATRNGKQGNTPSKQVWQRPQTISEILD